MLSTVFLYVAFMIVQLFVCGASVMYIFYYGCCWNDILSFGLLVNQIRTILSSNVLQWIGQKFGIIVDSKLVASYKISSQEVWQWRSQRGCCRCSSTLFSHGKLTKFKLSCIESIDVPYIINGQREAHRSDSPPCSQGHRSWRIKGDRWVCQKISKMHEAQQHSSRLVVIV